MVLAINITDFPTRKTQEPFLYLPPRLLSKRITRWHLELLLPMGKYIYIYTHEAFNFLCKLWIIPLKGKGFLPIKFSSTQA